MSDRDRVWAATWRVLQLVAAPVLLLAAAVVALAVLLLGNQLLLLRRVAEAVCTPHYVEPSAPPDLNASTLASLAASYVRARGHSNGPPPGSPCLGLRGYDAAGVVSGSPPP